MKNMKNKHGFTLAELLIVVAIIAVLVAVSIPVFTAQLEKSREATDIANIRSAYAAAVAAHLSDPEGTKDTAGLNKALLGETGTAKYNVNTGKFDKTGTTLKGTARTGDSGTDTIANITYERTKNYTASYIEVEITAGEVTLKINPAASDS